MIHFRTLLFPLLLGVAAPAFAQYENSITIAPGDSDSLILAKAAQLVPTKRQLDWQKLELTAFIHFGINTFTNREWGQGHEDEQLFNPTKLDAEQWVKTLKAAGFKLIVITAKHHDGFCLWPSKYTEHSVKKAPWKNGQGDVVRELSDACRKHGVQFGVYLSPWDRTEATYGTPAYNDYFVNQLTELLTQYGTVDEVWFDGANGESADGKKQVYDWLRYYKTIRQLQPQAVISGVAPDVRWVGTESGYGREQEWSVVPFDRVYEIGENGKVQRSEAEKPNYDMTGDVLGGIEQLRKAQKIAWYPAETDVSIRPGWFYHRAEDASVKSPEKLLDIYIHSVGRNGVLLLNLPPNKEGRLSPADVAALKGWKKLKDRVFKTNLAQQATLKVGETALNTATFTDGELATHHVWPSKKAAPPLELNWKKAVTFSMCVLQEDIAQGQRVGAFVLEAWDGTQWKPLANGTTIGYKRILTFPKTTAQRVRLRFLDMRAAPVLSEIGFYFYDPKTAAGNDYLKTPTKIQSIAISPAANPKYAANGPKTLFDQWAGNVFFDNGRWLGFDTNRVEMVVDLGTAQPIKKVTLVTLIDQGKWIFAPQQVMGSFSVDGKNFTPPVQINHTWQEVQPVERRKSVLKPTDKGAYRYVKIVLQNQTKLPAWHDAPGQQSWFFLDEIVVE